jgi:hypothetical protein
VITLRVLYSSRLHYMGYEVYLRPGVERMLQDDFTLVLQNCDPRCPNSCELLSSGTSAVRNFTYAALITHLQSDRVQCAPGLVQPTPATIAELKAARGVRLPVVFCVAMLL